VPRRPAVFLYSLVSRNRTEVCLYAAPLNVIFLQIEIKLGKHKTYAGFYFIVRAYAAQTAVDRAENDRRIFFYKNFHSRRRVIYYFRYKLIIRQIKSPRFSKQHSEAPF
jgi:hypothetical protein